MKVILTRDVKGLGRKDEVKDVPQGYAENFLLRNKYALVATARAIADHEGKRRRAAEEQLARDAIVRATLASIDGKRVEVKGRANDIGHLFAKIHAAEVAKAIESQLGPAVDPEWLVLEPELREVGERSVAVRASDAEAKVTVAVISA